VLISEFKSGDTFSGLTLELLDNEMNVIKLSNYSASAAHSTVLDEVSKMALSLRNINASNIFLPLATLTLNPITSSFDVYMNLYINPSESSSIYIISTFTYPIPDFKKQQFTF